ncbi:ribosome rescue protein RqcH [Candidatus Nanohalococcus occultus]|uniref:Component of the ribosome quality control (RQC) complex, YloA/Tae2 family, contains fibronectin-binding (FbpA) and DUF814 domains n=1 Tax=Candidatus Nanohalococcus occultus TaxID=2978047 RepID=A0ABY8CJR7_9ARCH|nr:Putative component of the ribosome quality control (RQC) complex, YloA/Tae2 family, contains fibronectin-binding (FbpA) and DUF814 domains [Candidatus Nanohaloarchaeota archaeon SVXNc]
MEITSLDLHILMEELNELEEGFVQKVYQRGEELTIEVYVSGEGKRRLIVGTSYCFLSKYKRDNPERPPGFCMELRKHMGRIDSIEQRGFDRILEIKSGEKTLICEMFGKGNIVLLDGDKVIGAIRQIEFKDRKIVVGEEYEYPEPATDPRELNDIFDAMDGELVRSLAADLSLGGTYAEEICSRLGIEKDRKIEELSDEEKSKVREEFNKLIEASENTEPVIYKDDRELIRAAPFKLETYNNYEIEEFESFSESLDEFFYRREQRAEERKKREKYEEKRNGLERQLEQQERKIEGLQKSSEQNRKIAELIYENYGDLLEIKEAIEKGLENHTWDEVEKRFNEAESELSDRIKDFNEQNRFIVVEVEDETVKVTPGEDLKATASGYYDKAKASEAKMEKAKEAKKNTEKQIEELGEEDIEVEDVMEDKTEKRSKKWFEKYRWFKTSEGFLVCAGRDSQTNEMLVKRHMDGNDLYFHADFDGAPSVVLKDGKDAGEKSIEQAAKAAVTFAKTWKAGIGADTVYYVEPDQVTKNPESGEYLPKGAFVIRGDREYIRNVKVDAAIGPAKLDEFYVPMCGPREAIEENCEISVGLKPGRTKKSDIAKTLNRKFADSGCEVDLDYIIRALPPGESEIE